jgi:hypothetical protein
MIDSSTSDLSLQPIWTLNLSNSIPLSDPLHNFIYTYTSSSSVPTRHYYPHLGAKHSPKTFKLSLYFVPESLTESAMISAAFVGLQPLIDQAVLQADGLCHVLL